MINKISVAKTNDGEATVAWIADGTEDIVLCNLLAETDGVCTNIGVDISHGSHVIKGLHSGKIYSIYLKTFNGTGWEISNSLEVVV